MKILQKIIIISTLISISSFVNAQSYGNYRENNKNTHHQIEQRYSHGERDNRREQHENRKALWN